MRFNVSDATSRPHARLVQVLEDIFGMTRDEAPKLMLKIHSDDSGEYGVYTVECASNIAARVNELASAPSAACSKRWRGSAGRISAASSATGSPAGYAALTRPTISERGSVLAITSPLIVRNPNRRGSQRDRKTPRPICK